MTDSEMSRMNRAPGLGSGAYRSIRRFTKKNQIDFNDLLKQSGLAVSADEPDLSVEEEERLVSALLTKTQCAFSTGFSMGLGYEAVDLGMLGFALITCDKLESTLAMCARYYAKAFHFTVPTMQQEPRGCCLYLQPIAGLSQSLAEFMVGRDVGIFLAMLKRAVGHQHKPYVEIGFDIPFRSAMHRIAGMFSIDVQFNQAKNYIVFDARLLNVPMPMANRETSLALEQAMQPYLNRVQHDGLLHMLKRLLKADLQSVPAMEDVASRLNMSARTLSRQIEKENTTWRKLITEVKLEKACELLSGTPKNLRAVAYEAGFASASSLCHSFVREKGCTPNQYRAISCQRLGEQVDASAQVEQPRMLREVAEAEPIADSQLAYAVD